MIKCIKVDALYLLRCKCLDQIIYVLICKAESLQDVCWYKASAILGILGHQKLPYNRSIFMDPG